MDPLNPAGHDRPWLIPMFSGVRLSQLADVFWGGFIEPSHSLDQYNLSILVHNNVSVQDICSNPGLVDEWVNFLPY